MTTRQPPDFPNLGFFRQLCTLAAADVELFEKDGDCDSVVALRMLSDDGRALRIFLLRFDDFLCTEVRELTNAAWRRLDQTGETDFTLEGSLAIWQAMIATIQANSGADARHTLNTLPGVALRLVASDPVNADKFYRFNQSYQDFINLAAKKSEAPKTNRPSAVEARRRG